LLLLELAIDKVAGHFAAIGMAQLAPAIGLVIFPVADIALAIGTQQHAEAVHLAVVPQSVEAVAGVGGEDAGAVEAAANGFTVIAPALAPAGDDVAVRNHAMDEKGGEALGLAVMAESGRAQPFRI